MCIWMDKDSGWFHALMLLQPKMVTDRWPLYSSYGEESHRVDPTSSGTPPNSSMQCPPSLKSVGATADLFLPAACLKTVLVRRVLYDIFLFLLCRAAGSISFQEWLEFMESPVGRDQHTFNCAGLHGLKEFKVPGEIGCEWCEQVIPMGSRALGCRLCDCDACLDCAALHMSTSEEQ